MNILRHVKGVDYITQQSSRKIIVQIDQHSDKEMVSQEILSVLVANDAHLQSFQRLTPSLDDVYLRYMEGSKHDELVNSVQR